VDRSLEPTNVEKLELVGRVLDMLPDFFYVHDYDLRFHYCNQRAVHYFGMQHESELIGRTLMEVDSNAGQAQRFLDVCREVMDSQQPRVTDNLPYRTSEGKEGLLRQYDIPFINPKTGTKMLIGLSRDITHERELEAQRLRAAKLEHELEIAKQIQAGLRPTSAPPGASGLDVAGFSRPAAFAGGDFYDWFPLPDGRIAMCLGDVTGHGVGPALIASACRAYARALLASHAIDDAFNKLDAMLASDLPPGHFVTFAAVLYCPRARTATVLSAGQGPLLHKHAAGVEQLEVQRPPLGLLSMCEQTTQPAAHSITLRSDEVIVLVSDGVYEAQNAQGQMLGLPSLLAWLTNEAGRTSSDALRGLQALHAAHQGEAQQEDDVTMLWMGCTPEAQSLSSPIHAARPSGFF
jgi:serine phosphatase RsbU (regulator of sigma subunit)